MSHQQPQRPNPERVSGEAGAIFGLERVLGALTHDLRAPVRHIQGFAGLLEDHLGSSLDEEAASYLQFMVAASSTIEEQMTALDRLSNSLGRSYVIEQHDANELVAKALDRLGPEVEDRRHEIDADDLPTVIGDRESLVAVFEELLANWIRFCPPGTRLRITSELGSAADHDSASQTLIFSDSGPGFLTDDPYRAFGLFKRFHDAKISGPGVGLAMVEQAVHRHGGSVSLATAPNEGVEVRLSLPTSPETVADAA